MLNTTEKGKSRPQTARAAKAVVGKHNHEVAGSNPASGTRRKVMSSYLNKQKCQPRVGQPTGTCFEQAIIRWFAEHDNMLTL